jgi:hypothetical protein
MTTRSQTSLYSTEKKALNIEDLLWLGRDINIRIPCCPSRSAPLKVNIIITLRIFRIIIHRNIVLTISNAIQWLGMSMYTGTRGIKNDTTIQNRINLFHTCIRIFITQTQLPLELSLPVGIQIDQQIYAPVKYAIFGMIRIEIRMELQKPLRFNSMYTCPMQRKFITNNVIHASNTFNLFYKIGTI